MYLLTMYLLTMFHENVFTDNIFTDNILFYTQISLPTADLECDLPTYVDLICGKIFTAVFVWSYVSYVNIELK